MDYDDFDISNADIMVEKIEINMKPGMFDGIEDVAIRKPVKKSFKEKEEAYARMLHKVADDLNCIFIEESWDGPDLETQDYYAECVWGWLCPKNDIRKTDEYFCCAEWKVIGEELTIEFVDYPDYF